MAVPTATAMARPAKAAPGDGVDAAPILRSRIPGRAASAAGITTSGPDRPRPAPIADPTIGGDLAPLITQREAITIAAAESTPAPAPAAAAAHDFDAVVDRLVEARQAGTAISANSTIAHSEFGHVRLRLDGRDGRIAITLSSSDPGFAPVASAAANGMPSIAAPGDMTADAPAGHSSPGYTPDTSPPQANTADTAANPGQHRQPAPREQATFVPSAPTAKAHASAAKPSGGVYA